MIQIAPPSFFNPAHNKKEQFSAPIYQVSRLENRLNVSPFITTRIEQGNSLRIINSVTVDGQLWELKKPIAVFLSEQDGHFFAENEELTLLGSGETEVAALEDFYSFLAGTWEGLRGQPDAELDESAQVLRDKLLKHFGAA